jgi:hypothetical protein
MRLITTLAAAALMAGSASLALAQSSGGAASGGTGAGGAPAAPQLDTSRPSATPPSALRRGDQMAPMQQSNVSNRVITKKKRSTDRTYR